MRARGYNQVNIFGEQDGSEYFRRLNSSIGLTIQNEKDDYLLNINEENYLDHVVEKFTIEPLIIHRDKTYASSYEASISADKFPSGFHVRTGKSYNKDVIKYHIPYSGDKELLRFVPNPASLWTMTVTVDNNEITFDIINFSNNSDQIKNEADNNISSIMTNHGHLTAQIEAFNNQIRAEAKKAFDARKQHILNKSDLLSSLGVPVKKNESVSETFAVSSVKAKPKITIVKPHVHEEGFSPDPTLDDTTYQQILKVIHDVGKQFEKLPGTYSDKDEEQLRDHFLLILEPNFEGSATGETFNKSGKTDILLRHDGNNVFIAECKFWHGEKGFLATIDQLLGYLTWRDSKAAIVVFVENKDFSNVLSTVKSATPKHPNFIRSYSEHDETWFNYGIHLQGDENREVKVAVMLFHLPK